jgi:hypothetical protein
MKRVASVFIVLFCSSVVAKTETESPWLFTPLLSVDPKLSSSIGILGGYLHQFDEDSPSSLFGITGNYSDTQSWTAAVFAKTYFSEDTQRITAAVARGEIRNDYDDYLGTGLEVETKDQLEFFIFRYSHQIWPNWYLGAQVLNSHYQILGLDQLLLNTNNLVTEPPGFDANDSIFGFDSIGVGLTVEFDSRNDQRAASAGNYFLLHNIAYRESFGGDEDFDTLDMRFTHYLAHGSGNVLAINITGRWTKDAPPSGYSSVFTKGYTRGQYLAPYLSSIELDERIRFTRHWGMTAYAAVACLYGETDFSETSKNLSCSDTDNIYPSAALGISYALKPDENIFLRAEAAVGKGDNHGVYLSFGHPF